MNKLNKTTQIWSFELSTGLEAAIRAMLGKKFQFSAWKHGVIPSQSVCEKAEPALLLLSPAGLRLICSAPPHKAQHLKTLPRLALLEESYTQDELEMVLDAGAARILRPPHKAAVLRDAIKQIISLEDMQDVFLRMIQEISLEREILEHKNQTLNFLVNFLTEIPASIDPGRIIQQAFRLFQPFCDLRDPQAVLWDPLGGDPRVQVYLSAPEKSPARSFWMTTICEAVRATRPLPADKLEFMPLGAEGETEHIHQNHPAGGRLVTLPLTIDNMPCGMLMGLTGHSAGLSRDQAMTLNAALRCLSLALQNAMRFQSIKKETQEAVPPQSEAPRTSAPAW
ncbi:MAG: hypothetical protein LBD82_05845 [Deltaproteobacteria bacterium]|jgi:hypothetical protein|nr:hypothetical protein [Deltaproteobacteria bacterium]